MSEEGQKRLKQDLSGSQGDQLPTQKEETGDTEKATEKPSSPASATSQEEADADLMDADLTKALGFQKTIQQHVFGGFVTLGLSLGSRLGLFDELMKHDEAISADQLAQETRCKAR